MDSNFFHDVKSHWVFFINSMNYSLLTCVGGKLCKNQILKIVLQPWYSPNLGRFPHVILRWVRTIPFDKAKF